MVEVDLYLSHSPSLKSIQNSKKITVVSWLAAGQTPGFHQLVTGCWSPGHTWSSRNPGDFSSFLAIRFFFRALAWIPAPFSEMSWFSEMETPMEYRNWGVGDSLSLSTNPLFDREEVWMQVHANITSEYKVNTSDYRDCPLLNVPINFCRRYPSNATVGFILEINGTIVRS